MISTEINDKFDPKKYNAIIRRFREYWTTYFLKEIYNSESSLNALEIWVYRGKQFGVLQATDFYPGFTGRIIYPTSLLKRSVSSDDFQKFYQYEDGSSLFVYKPLLGN